MYVRLKENTFYSILFCCCYRYHGWTTTTHQLRTPTSPPRRPTCQVRNLPHGLINYTDTKLKCTHVQKLTCKGTLRQDFIRLRPLSLLWPQTSPLFPYTLYSVYVYCILIHTRKVAAREFWTRDKIGGAIVHKAGWKISKWLIESPV